MKLQYLKILIAKISILVTSKLGEIEG